MKLFKSKSGKSCSELCIILLAGMVATGGIPANAQPENSLKLQPNVMKYLAYDKLSSTTKALIDSAIQHYDYGDYLQSSAALRKVLLGDGIYKPKDSLHAWSHQWLALNYFALDSVSTAKQHVILAFDKDIEVWREYGDSRIPQGLRMIYQDHIDSIVDNLIRKRSSLRVALGTILRADFSQRYGSYDLVLGLGSPAVFVRGEDVLNSKFRSFKQILFYTRGQWMRKNLERLTPGFYIEFSLLEQDLRIRDFTEGAMRFRKVLSGGPIFSYVWKSGLEMGGSTEIARLLFGKESDLAFSQTAFKESFTLTYGNFEVYFRKWF